MMKNVAFGVISLLLLLASCKEEENYPAEPQITIDDIVFIKESDSIFITLTITDGDKDFGLDPNNRSHSIYPFNAEFFVKKSNGQLVPSENIDLGNGQQDTNLISDLLKFGDRFTPPYDTLSDWSAINYTSVDPSKIPDLDKDLYYKYNSDHCNLMISCPAIVQHYEPKRRFHGLFDLRIPQLSKKKQQVVARVPFIFSEEMHGQTITFQVWAKDRALHKSNVIETPFIIE
jgi:hypothetical protein